MKAYFITEREMEGLRDALQLAFLRHCEHYGIKSNLVNSETDHSVNLWFSFNFAYCRWRDAMGDDHAKSLSIEGMQSKREQGFDLAMEALRKAKVSDHDVFNAVYEQLKIAFSADEVRPPEEPSE